MHITIHTYAQLEQYLKGFTAGHCNLLVIIGSAGLQKSVSVEKECPEAQRLSGTVTAFEFYRELYRHRDQDFIVDDVDELYRDKSMIRLLKALCDTRATKSVHWHSSTIRLEEEDIPTQFTTQTRLVLIANVWKNINKNIGALHDRGIVLNFKPSAEEVHVRTADWYKDGEIYAFVGEHLHLIRQPSMRYYRLASELKAMNLDWRNALLQDWAHPEQNPDHDRSAAEIIHAALKENREGLDRTQLHGLFHRNRKAIDITDAISELLVNGKIRQKAQPNTIGRPAMVFVAAGMPGVTDERKNEETK